MNTRTEKKNSCRHTQAEMEKYKLCSALSRRGTYLPRQLNHLEIPRTQTVIGVDRPVVYVVTLTVSLTFI